MTDFPRFTGQRDVFPFKKTTKALVQTDNPKLGRQWHCSVGHTTDTRELTRKNQFFRSCIHTHFGEKGFLCCNAALPKDTLVRSLAAGAGSAPSAALIQGYVTCLCSPPAAAGPCPACSGTLRELRAAGTGDAKGAERGEHSRGTGPGDGPGSAEERGAV